MIICEHLKVNNIASLLPFDPCEVPALHLDLNAHLGCRRHISAWIYIPVNIRNKETKAYGR